MPSLHQSHPIGRVLPRGACHERRSLEGHAPSQLVGFGRLERRRLFPRGSSVVVAAALAQSPHGAGRAVRAVRNDHGAVAIEGRRSPRQHLGHVLGRRRRYPHGLDQFVRASRCPVVDHRTQGRRIRIARPVVLQRGPHRYECRGGGGGPRHDFVRHGRGNGGCRRSGRGGGPTSSRLGRHGSGGRVPGGGGVGALVVLVARESRIARGILAIVFLVLPADYQANPQPDRRAY
mmetsp:Transcript_5633/g.14087  ORF Transcript_5633/g.14087 Transcript_5633/m.14087 type:complete len:233 (-) Transcript_5633:320-1018(-)